MASHRILPRGGGQGSDGRGRPLIGVMCCNRQSEGRAVQSVATRFIEPLVEAVDACVMLVPALPDAIDMVRFAGMLDGLLLTGACSHLAAAHYGGGHGPAGGPERGDAGRDEVALGLAGRMIEGGKPVFGICRGLQEINVLFGGSLTPDVGAAGHHRDGEGLDLADLFDHHHQVEIAADGLLAGAAGGGAHRVNSVHHQGIDRLGGGLRVEARAVDGLVEAVSASPCGAPVLGVQWHPEWDARANPASQAFFEALAMATRGRA